MSKIISHLKTIIKHKFEVFKACVSLGIPWLGFMHDWSKFSPIEFFESAKYYTGTSSPIDQAKIAKGYSLAWMHHKGHNPHHWEYWIDWCYETGALQIARKMPFKRCLEFMADCIGAGKTYEGKEWTILRPFERWMINRDRYMFHKETRLLLTILFKAYSNGRLTKNTISDLKFKYEHSIL